MIRTSFHNAGESYGSLNMIPYIPPPTTPEIQSNTKYIRISAAALATEGRHADTGQHILREHIRKLDPTQYIYTDGSLITGNPTLGAGIIYPETGQTIRMKIASDPIRHTINRAELAAITHALVQDDTSTNVQILTDSAYSINSIRNFCHAPYKYKDNIHYDLLKMAASALQKREEAGLTTHIGKVKSHTGIQYNDAADEAANTVAKGGEYDMVFDQADPPPGGLRVWPGTLPPDNTADPTPFRDIKKDSKKSATRTRKAPPTTKHGMDLRAAHAEGADFSVHAYSRSTFSRRAAALEVSWGIYHNKFRHGLPKDQPLLCRQCSQPITIAHITGDCASIADMRTARHNSTFKLLKQHLEGTREPIIASDLGQKPIKRFDRTKYVVPNKTERSPITPAPAAKIPEFLLPKHKLPTGHKPDMIRLKGCVWPPKGPGRPSVPKRPGYTGPKVMQLIECKYATDTNMHETIAEIKEKYAPLCQAIRDHGTWDGEIEIIPIVISRTGSFHVQTLAEIAKLISPLEEPPDNLTYKQLPRRAQNTVMALHVHAQEWLYDTLGAARNLIAPRRGYRRSDTRAQHIREKQGHTIQHTAQK